MFMYKCKIFVISLFNLIIQNMLRNALCCYSILNKIIYLDQALNIDGPTMTITHSSDLKKI